jgi:hypothetical protein
MSMRWPFRREPSGRHALGAAVTGIPAAPPAPPRAALLSPVVSAPAVAPVDGEPFVPAQTEPVEAPALPVPTPPSRPPLGTPCGPRVELGFTDGTYGMLDPASDTALALAELVGELTGASSAGVSTQLPGAGSARP